jgi:hypothetical protein
MGLFTRCATTARVSTVDGRAQSLSLNLSWNQSPVSATIITGNDNSALFLAAGLQL